MFIFMIMSCIHHYISIYSSFGCNLPFLVLMGAPAWALVNVYIDVEGGKPTSPTDPRFSHHIDFYVPTSNLHWWFSHGNIQHIHLFRGFPWISPIYCPDFPMDFPMDFLKAPFVSWDFPPPSRRPMPSIGSVSRLRSLAEASSINGCFWRMTRKK